MVKEKAGGPPGPAMLQLSTCGEAESENWHGSVSLWGWRMGWCMGGGWGLSCTCLPSNSLLAVTLTLHYLQVLSGWRHELLYKDEFCVCLQGGFVCVCN